MFLTDETGRNKKTLHTHAPPLRCYILRDVYNSFSPPSLSLSITLVLSLPLSGLSSLRVPRWYDYETHTEEWRRMFFCKNFSSSSSFCCEPRFSPLPSEEEEEGSVRGVVYVYVCVCECFWNFYYNPLLFMQPLAAATAAARAIHIVFLGSASLSNNV